MIHGTYNYFLNGKPTGVSETFSIETLPDGAKLTVCERNTTIYGTRIYLKAEQNGEKFVHFDIRITNENNAATADVHAFYEFSADEFPEISVVEFPALQPTGCRREAHAGAGGQAAQARDGPGGFCPRREADPRHGLREMSRQGQGQQ